MGASITLEIGKFEIDYGINDFFNNHSLLFQKDDLKKIQSPYDDQEEIYLYTKKLKYIRDRLDMLGYTLRNLEKQYNSLAEKFAEERVLTFQELQHFIMNIDILKISIDGLNCSSLKKNSSDYPLLCLLYKEEYSIFLPKNFKVDIYNEDIYKLIEPYLLLRIIAEKNDNIELEVNWRIDNLLDSGWIELDDVKPEVEDQHKVCIITEGSSDSKFLKRTLELFKPHISDLFYFIDMRENYPFTGTGELVKFYKGLIKLNTQNKILFIFDNDTEGIMKFKEIKKLKHNLDNIHVTHLPNSIHFENFSTSGPSGDSYENINGKAVSIECFTDLEFLASNPKVRWTNYVDKVSSYQGSLIGKSIYLKNASIKNLNNEFYNKEKIYILLDEIIKQIRENL